MGKARDDLTAKGWKHVERTDLISAFGDDLDGYIMIYLPRYKWFPEKLGRWFPKMMKWETFPVSAEATNNPEVMTLVEREEE